MSTNYYPLLMKCFPALMTITKLGGYPLTFQNLSRKCGTRKLFINLGNSGNKLRNLLSLLTDFLRNRKQRTILNGQGSSWANINTCVPKGPVLGPLFFHLIYINDFNLILSYSLTIRPCFLLLKCAKEQLTT